MLVCRMFRVLACLLREHEVEQVAWRLEGTAAEIMHAKAWPWWPQRSRSCRSSTVMTARRSSAVDGLTKRRRTAAA